MSQEQLLVGKRDIIAFTLKGEQAIKNETVRMTVSILAQVAGRKEDDVRREIHDALERLIKTRWNLSNIQRTAHIGDEVISLTAVARVAEAENRDLENRVRAISKRGLTVNTPQVNYSFPLDEVEKKRGELRLALLSEATKHLAAFNKSVADMGGENAKAGPYHIGLFATNESDEDVPQRLSNKFSASSYSVPAGGPADALAHTGKLVMHAQVELHRDR